ncbi:MAG: serine--tRNA ligase [Candidatus Fraserbacteria bacterium RBG_16_55_9]|uniref:Serine--tRNA ligase n=1 Tax=Fraserbacteria sp. (strain RBG_16_55_9) TaxID=1817864 RepID=A0A1F5V1N6_FRAXR|nr:MAG: serine--tRNA ligase [Candidatus Fraserbacteria bacterium RBG_16_55_9]
MLDIKAIREQPKEIENKLKARDPALSLDRLLLLDERRRKSIQEVETLKNQRNKASEEIARFKTAQREEEAQARIREMRQTAERIKTLEDELAATEEELNNLLIRLPNLPHESVPVSMRKEDKIVVREHKTLPTFEFEPKHHLDLGEELGILDFPRAARIAGARFPLYKGWGARLEMALINFFLDFHFTQTGYTPILPPYLGNSETMFTASQLPKFKDDVYYIEKDDLYLNPTAETLLCSLHRDEILEASQLPLKYMAYTACFRREAGAAGEEERGLIRMHQFNKVELFKFTRAEDSFDELESLVRDAEAVLQPLDLHYRVVLLPTSDIAAQSAKTYDLEVWIPSQRRYYEVSSCSNCTDYQARRGSIRYRPEPGAKPEYVHTLNGSALATSRLLSALLETNQRADGSVVIPEVLRDYVGGSVIQP